jgi:hypothetical protein
MTYFTIARYDAIDIVHDNTHSFASPTDLFVRNLLVLILVSLDPATVSLVQVHASDSRFITGDADDTSCRIPGIHRHRDPSDSTEEIRYRLEPEIEIVILESDDVQRLPRRRRLSVDDRDPACAS